MADHDRDSAASASDSDTAAPTLASRHRAEWKQLRATIQALKRSAGKGDKKRKREVAVEIARLEKEMEERHAREVAEEQSGAKADAVGAIVDAMAAVGVNGDADETTAVDAPAQTTTGGTGKKPNRQQLRKQRKQAALDDMRREAQAEAATAVDWRAIETEAVRDLLAGDGRRVFEIPPDGHCLYSAIAHQLNTDGGTRTAASSLTHDQRSVRRLAADFLLANPQDFLPFLDANDESSDEPMDNAGYTAYCDRVATSAEWGGQVELQALARALRREVRVYQMGMPVMRIGEDVAETGTKPLCVSYHRHSYGLGEHYNSTVVVADGA